MAQFFTNLEMKWIGEKPGWASAWFREQLCEDVFFTTKYPI
jgi:hypothetical protein